MEQQRRSEIFSIATRPHSKLTSEAVCNLYIQIQIQIQFPNSTVLDRECCVALRNALMVKNSFITLNLCGAPQPMFFLHLFSDSISMHTGNGICDNGCVSLSESLKLNNSLTSLNLRGALITKHDSPKTKLCDQFLNKFFC